VTTSRAGSLTTIPSDTELKHVAILSESHFYSQEISAFSLQGCEKEGGVEIILKT
jgi:hypothetical protein